MHHSRPAAAADRLMRCLSKRGLGAACGRRQVQGVRCKVCQGALPFLPEAILQHTPALAHGRRVCVLGMHHRRAVRPCGMCKAVCIRVALGNAVLS